MLHVRSTLRRVVRCYPSHCEPATAVAGVSYLVHSRKDAAMRPSFKGFVATAVAIASVSATSAAATTCTLLPAELVTLPSDFGIDQCIGNNSGDLLNVLFAPNSKCSLDQLMAMANSKPLQGLLAFFADVMEAPDKISASLYKYMQATGDSQMNAFHR